jgi:hypothetical protein
MFITTLVTKRKLSEKFSNEIKVYQIRKHHEEIFSFGILYQMDIHV